MRICCRALSSIRSCTRRATQWPRSKELYYWNLLNACGIRLLSLGLAHWIGSKPLKRQSFFLHFPRVFKMPAGWQLVNHLEHPKVMGTQRFFRKGQETLVKKICCHRWCNEQMSSAEEFKISQHQQSSFSCFTKAAMSKNKVQHGSTMTQKRALHYDHLIYMHF